MYVCRRLVILRHLSAGISMFACIYMHAYTYIYIYIHMYVLAPSSYYPPPSQRWYKYG